MAKVKKFNDKYLKQMIQHYKDGESIEDLKKRYGCYGNALVRRLKQAHVYKPKRARRALIGNAVSVFIPGRKHRKR